MPSTEETHCDWSFLPVEQCGGKCHRNDVLDTDLEEATRGDR